jgi:hypothetical protein
MISLQTAEIDPNVVKPGWVALLIVLALGAATVLLWRNMGKQLKRIDVDHAGADDPAPSAGPASPADSQSPAGDAEPKTSAPSRTPSDAKEHKEHLEH